MSVQHTLRKAVYLLLSEPLQDNCCALANWMLSIPCYGYVQSTETPMEHLEKLTHKMQQYNGFNLVVADLPVHADGIPLKPTRHRGHGAAICGRWTFRTEQCPSEYALAKGDSRSDPVATDEACQHILTSFYLHLITCLAS